VCCKQASSFYKTKKYFHINKNDTGYHNARSLSLTHSRELCSITEQMPALVLNDFLKSLRLANVWTCSVGA
jgi:hypothetical protein